MANQQLIDYIKKAESQGFEKQQLKEYLIKKGYNSKEVDEAFSSLDKNISKPKKKKLLKYVALVFLVLVVILISYLTFDFLSFREDLRQERMEQIEKYAISHEDMGEIQEKNITTPDSELFGPESLFSFIPPPGFYLMEREHPEINPYFMFKYFNNDTIKLVISVGISDQFASGEFRGIEDLKNNYRRKFSAQGKIVGEDHLSNKQGADMYYISSETINNEEKLILYAAAFKKPQEDDLVFISGRLEIPSEENQTPYQNEFKRAVDSFMWEK